MIALKLAYRNLIGAGLRTWLNVFILSLSFVVIIWHRGILDGWNAQAKRDTIAWQIGGGQFWHENYDPYDPFTIEESHAPIPVSWKDKIASGEMTPVLIVQSTIYPEGRMRSALLRGIDPDQTVLKIPTRQLDIHDEILPVLIGTRMAKNNNLKKDSFFTIRWRDANGTYDAAEAKVSGIFKTNLPPVDNGQIYVPLKRLQQMTGMTDEATLTVIAPDTQPPEPQTHWTFRDHNYLLEDFEAMIAQKSIGGSILYIILLSLAMLAIFDTQVLSVFRRQKEIGTHVALGMTRWQVIQIFTIEGAMHAVLAAGVAAIYGIPLLSLQAVKGFAMPAGFDDYGLPLAERIFPIYSGQLILLTVLIVFVIATIVSYLPARKIAKMNPTDAIRGKLQ